MIVGLRDFMESGGLDFSDTGARQRVVSRLVARKIPIFSVGKNIRGRVRGVWFNADQLLLKEELARVIVAHQEVAAAGQDKPAQQPAKRGRGNGHS